MVEYPKIETYYERDSKSFTVLPDCPRCPEFALVNRWLVTEKIDGTNIRIHLRSDGTVTYGGRTDAAQLHAPLVAWLLEHCPHPVVAAAFDPGTEAILFGEGYGAGIQKGGLYRPGPGFRLFDVLVIVAGEDRWWLNWESVEDIAGKLCVPTVPVLARGVSVEEAVGMVRAASITAKEDGGAGGQQEGIVARTEPLLMLRDGRRRLMWKLKGKDLA